MMNLSNRVMLLAIAITAFTIVFLLWFLFVFVGGPCCETTNYPHLEMPNASGVWCSYCGVRP